MAFTQFKSIMQVSAAYGVQTRSEELLPGLAEVEPPAYLSEIIRFSNKKRKSVNNEQFMREGYIAPILFDVLRSYEWLNIWINEFELKLDETLCGYPDYLFSSLPHPSAIDTAGQRPFVAMAEAKKENFTEGWGQCLAEMYACQRLNEEPETVIWGIVTTGELWQFGKLEGNVFARHNTSIDLDPLGKLLAVLHYIFKQCDDAARKAAGADRR